MIGRGLTRRELIYLAAIAGTGIGVPFRLNAEEKPGRWLDAAIKAGRWIRTTRVATPDGLLWLGGPERPEGMSASPELYTGTSGVVLFLVELARVTGDESWLQEAAAGADWLIAGLPAALDGTGGAGQAQAGLYTGVPGIGLAIYHVAKATDKEPYRRGAERCLDLVHAGAKPAGAGVEWDPGLDVIAGSAGTILYLLHMARELDRPASRELALAAGMRLAELGIPDAGGRKWRMANDPEAKRLMPNFSHGTAGIAYALATLHLETGRKEPLDAALAGARYLQSVANTEGDGCLIFHHEPEPDGRDLYYLGWCHGPAGTVRLFYQLAKATKDEGWTSWAKRGTRSILASGIPEKQTPGFWNNAGQCCGLAGVADLFLRLHKATGEGLDFARKVGEALLAKATPAGDGLKWVHAEHRVKPDYVYAQTGYMQGAAGIGMLLLHLDAVERGREWGFRLPDSPY
ncbi:MAG TPA: lanthionine synthetase LanC family protein [Thermoanaerobaculia bacterium]|nr:lanthionine synthetase LanC family protein [Thermoanaerobaculia bacterium]